MTLVRFKVHVDSVEGGEDRGLLAETKPCLGSFKLFLSFPGSERRDQDGEVANAKRNTNLDGTWIMTKGRTKKRGSKFSNERAKERRDEKHRWRGNRKRSQTSLAAKAAAPMGDKVCESGVVKMSDGENCSPMIASRAPGIFRIRMA